MRLGIKTSTKPVKKTFEQIVGGIVKAVQESAEMRKAREGLVQREVEVHRGGKTFKQRRWVKPGEDVPQPKGKKVPEQGSEKKTTMENVIQKIKYFEDKAWEAHDKAIKFKEMAEKAEKNGGTAEKFKKEFEMAQAEKNRWADKANEFKLKKYHLERISGGQKDSTTDKKRLGIRKPQKGNDNQGQGGIEFKRGDKVTGTDTNGEKVSGTVTAVGADGVTIDGQYHVEHGKVKKETGNTTDAGKQPIGKKENQQGGGEAAVPKRTFISPDKFNANEYAKQWDDPKATADEAGYNYILDSFGKEGAVIAKNIRETEEKLKFGAEDRDTQKKFLISGKGESARYKEVREKLHGAIMQTLLAPDKIRMAKPDPNSEPTFTILGGRGGSGKSWFKGKVYDPAKCVVLDADEIKAMLPEYQGWNAQDVHEESSDILEQMIGMCIREGLNVVLDATMKTADSAIAKVLRFKSAGYKVEAHYMHLPSQEAAKRAIGRFKGENGDYTGRYVPVNIILKNTTNEDSFDQVRRMADKWSFRDSNGKKGEQPILISEGKKEVKKSFSELVKKIQRMYN
ncbi:MAG: zeta toxin family protein [Spirochaetaceae bacterium]|jgi:predicted ABC-type ATPase|nr:zeta toxin family protein [Spirochaetaceae bacterium]